MRKVCVVITARPSYSRIRSALVAMQEHPNIDLRLVVTGSAFLERYGRVIDVIKSDGFRVDAELFSVVEGANLTQSIKSVGLGLLELSTALEKIKPDAVLTIADRYETIATAISASYLNIPLLMERFIHWSLVPSVTRPAAI